MRAQRVGLRLPGSISRSTCGSSNADVQGCRPADRVLYPSIDDDCFCCTNVFNVPKGATRSTSAMLWSASPMVMLRCTERRSRTTTCTTRSRCCKGAMHWCSGHHAWPSYQLATSWLCLSPRLGMTMRMMAALQPSILPLTVSWCGPSHGWPHAKTRTITSLSVAVAVFRQAMNYNDISPLENMHARNTFLIMREPSCNIFANVDTAQRKTSRKSIVAMILATDMQWHVKKQRELESRKLQAVRVPAETCSSIFKKQAQDCLAPLSLSGSSLIVDR
eukprot:SAG31_NODE_1118_length_9816_cov_41.561593_5_plen_276_part_00